MGMNKGFNAEKAVEVILYIISKGCCNMYNILKVIYFADKERLSMVGSTMFKESYKAMPAGPVPCGSYDLLKDVRDGRSPHYDVELPFAFDGDDTNIVYGGRGPEMGLLSRVDVKCLDDAVAKYGDMPFRKLRNISHEQDDYNAVGLNEWIPFDALVASVDDEKGTIKSYLQSI